MEELSETTINKEISKSRVKQISTLKTASGSCSLSPGYLHYVAPDTVKQTVMQFISA